MKQSKKSFFQKIAWIAMVFLFIVLGDVLLFYTFDLSLWRDSDIENMSGVAAIYMGSKVVISLFSFWYLVIMSGIGLVCMDQWKQKFVMKLFPIKNHVIKCFFAPALVYIIFLLLFVHDFLLTGVFAMLCYMVANYLSAIWFDNAYSAYRLRNHSRIG